MILLAEKPPDLDLPKPESDDAMNAIKEQVEALADLVKKQSAKT